MGGKRSVWEDQWLQGAPRDDEKAMGRSEGRRAAWLLHCGSETVSSGMALPSHFLSLFSLAKSNVSFLTLGLCRSSGDEPPASSPSRSRKTCQ